jgi:chemotaxis protein methyltransferase CheR
MQIISREFPFTESDFRHLANLLKRHTGISLSDKKGDLVYARLASRIRDLGIATFRDYIKVVDGPDGEAERDHLVNALTTNLTRFFREPFHFKHFYNVAIPDCVERVRDNRKKRLRLWSAGCSSGEEAYSMAMTLRQRVANLDQMDVRILATDLDTDVLTKAARGQYPPAALENLPDELRKRFVSPLGKGDRDDWVIRKSVRSLISFKRLNLIEDWPMSGKFDVIFCRNVMIYFDSDTTHSLLTRFADILRPGGWLYIGHSENILGMTKRFERVGNTTYRKVD